MAAWTTSPAGTTAARTSSSPTATLPSSAASPATTRMAVTRRTAWPSRPWARGPTARSLGAWTTDRKGEERAVLDEDRPGGPAGGYGRRLRQRTTDAGGWQAGESVGA